MNEKFLISRLSSLGDVVCSLPAAGALKNAFPDCEITWAVDPRFQAIVRACRFVDRVEPVSPKLNPKSWPTLDGEFDAALDLQGLLKSAVVVKNVKAKRKLGYHWQREGAWLFSQRIIPDPTSLHIVDQYVDVARAAGGEATEAQFGIVPSSEAIASATFKIPEGRFVVVNPGAGWETKRWPIESVVEFCRLMADAQIMSVLIGSSSQEEQAIASRIMASLDERTRGFVVPLGGKTNIDELIAVLSLAIGHVGGDTGSTHLAAALGIPAFGLYSITRPERSCPYRQIDQCLYDRRGLRFIPPFDVLAKVKEAIQA
jgi:heptosyltransferase-1